MKKVTQAVKKPITDHRILGGKGRKTAEKEWKDIRHINTYGGGIKMYSDLKDLARQ